MEKEDFRTLTAEAQYQIKKAAIKMVKSGKSQTYVPHFFNVTRKSLYTWLKQYAEKGSDGLQQSKRGRRQGEQRTLTVQQENRIQNLIIDKCPEQLKLPFALWTRKAIQELIEMQFDMLLPIRTIGEYLKRWGFTPQKPLRRAYEQKPQVTKEWIDKVYPDIQTRAKKEHAEIYWGDETGLSSEDNRGRGYSPQGVTPIRFTTGARFSTSMISAIANQGQMRFMIYKGAMDINIFKLFLTRLIKDVKRKVFLIIDNLRVHHAKKIQAWIKDHNDKIELFFLPPYTPERNPDEYLNQDVKVSLSHKKAPKNQEELSNNLRTYMKSLQKNTTKIKHLFHHELVKYAA
jgi:transposase